MCLGAQQAAPIANFLLSLPEGTPNFAYDEGASLSLSPFVYDDILTQNVFQILVKPYKTFSEQIDEEEKSSTSI